MRVFVLVAALLVACGNDNESGSTGTGPCAGVTCSGHGTCSVQNNAAVCTCNSGYHVSGTACLADTAGGGSCTDPGGQFCITFSGSGYTPSAVQTGCAQSSTTYSANACSTTNSIGSCRVNTELASEFVVVFYSGTITVEQAQSVCAQAYSGTWTPAT